MVCAGQSPATADGAASQLEENVYMLTRSVN